MAAAKDLALLALNHSEKLTSLFGAALNLAGFIVGLNKEKNKSDCILALHAGKELMRIEVELRLFPDLNGKFERLCAELYDLIPFGKEMDAVELEQAKELAKSITDLVHELKKYATELNTHFASCSLVETTEMMEYLSHLTCACSTIEDCLKALKKTLQSERTPTQEEMEKFDSKYRSISQKQEGINDAFKTCNNCLD